MIIGFDWDGTLVESWTSTPLPGVRERLAALPRNARTFIATNQAGPVYRAVLGDPKYPTVADVADRLIGGLAALDWRPDLLLICVSSGKTESGWFVAETNARTDLYDALEGQEFGLMIEIAASYRKPAPRMFHAAAQFFGGQRGGQRVDTYIGDMDSDRQAAVAAGCRFISASIWRECGLL